jgi:uncharacterized membrane protein YphA (DoxX/SURF4 family)
MLSRRIARPLLATWFVAEGLDAARRPAPHVERVRDGWRRLALRMDVPQPPHDDQLRVGVRIHGAATAVAGLMLALGKAPRFAACALAVLTVPVAVLDATRDRGASAQPATTDRAMRPLLRDLSLIGGAGLAALDKEGKPSLGWRMQHAHVDREAGRAVAAARKEAKSIIRQTVSAARTAKAHAPTP